MPTFTLGAGRHGAGEAPPGGGDGRRGWERATSPREKINKRISFRRLGRSAQGLGPFTEALGLFVNNFNAGYPRDVPN